MRRFVATVALLGALGGGTYLMMEATQNRPDARVPGSFTTVEFTVSTNGYHRGDAGAATALWAVCSATVGGHVSAVPEADGGGWRATVEPAIGEHGENRLIGCIEDVTLDRVIGNVTSLTSTS
jgi:hypothetical protein